MTKPPDREAFAILANAFLLLRRFGLGVLAAEALDAARCIHKLLLTREEWMAVGADFHVDVALVGRPGGEAVAAGAKDADFFI
jgi:hypothetical protein